MEGNFDPNKGDDDSVKDVEEEEEREENEEEGEGEEQEGGDGDLRMDPIMLLLLNRLVDERRRERLENGEDATDINLDNLLLEIMRNDDDDDDVVDEEDGNVILYKDECLPPIIFMRNVEQDSVSKGKITFKCNHEINGRSSEKISTVQFQFPKFTGKTSPAILKGIQYFEMTCLNLLERRNDNQRCNAMGIGLAPAPYENGFVGWYKNSIGFHSDDGSVFDNVGSQDLTAKEKEKYGQGDTVGCLYNLKSGVIEFTKNGKKIKQSKVYKRKGEMYYPCISVALERDFSCSFSINTGENTIKNPFAFDQLNIKPSKKLMNATKFCDVLIKFDSLI